MQQLYFREMNNIFSITSSARVINGIAKINGEPFYKSTEEEELHVYTKSLYRELDMRYPKFFKMDLSCKLAMIAGEMIWKERDVRQLLQGDDIAIVLMNKASSLDTDREFNRSITDFGDWFPSPAIFVYTLPNIMAGEICIKKNITGENAFFIFDEFDAGALLDYVSEILANDRAKACLCGWCDVDGGVADAFFLLVEKDVPAGNLNFSVENIDKLYNQK